MSTRRPTLVHRLEFHLYQVVERTLAKLSLDDCVKLGRVAGGITYRLTSRYRRLVRRNLRIATAREPLDPRLLEQMVMETFKRSAANFLASLRTQLSSSAELLDRIDTEGFHLMTNPDPSSHGLLIAMPHMGNWEALSQLGPTLSPIRRYGGIYRPLANPLMDEFTRRRRTSKGARLFSRNDGFHPPSALLREGGALLVLADQRAGASGTPMPFLGKMTTCSPLPNLMARRSKSQVAVLGIASKEGARWDLQLFPVDEDISTVSIMKQLERAMEVSLTDVFWFHDRWRIDRARPLSFFTKTDPEVAATAAVPLRLILTTPVDAPEAGVQQLLKAMFQFRPDLRIDRLAAPGVGSSDPRVVLHVWDHDLPPEQCDGLIRRIDHSHPGPLDGALLLGSERPLAQAAKRFDLRSIIGIQVKGKPWTRSLDHPETPDQWACLAHQMAQVPTRRRA